MQLNELHAFCVYGVLVSYAFVMRLYIANLQHICSTLMQMACFITVCISWRKKRIFDDMNNGFGWDRLPKSFMAENTAFLLLTALIRNFYKAIIQRLDAKRFGLNATSRIKAFVFKFISVPAKWIKTSRRYVLNIYTCNNAYADVFQTDFG